MGDKVFSEKSAETEALKSCIKRTVFCIKISKCME